MLVYLKLDPTEGKAQPGDVQGRVRHFVKIFSRDDLPLNLRKPVRSRSAGFPPGPPVWFVC